MSASGILGRLTTICPFPEAFEDIDDDDGPGQDSPRRKIGHLRADYDGYRWWSTVWPSHWEMATPEVKAEMGQTYETLIAEEALHNLDAIRRFCWAHPEAKANKTADDEFNFYLVGETCDFWVRLITREKDYNMYLNAFAKADSQEAE